MGKGGHGYLDVGDFDGKVDVGILCFLRLDTLEKFGTGEWDDALVLTICRNMVSW